jgi:hypothetical protein
MQQFSIDKGAKINAVIGTCSQPNLGKEKGGTKKRKEKKGRQKARQTISVSAAKSCCNWDMNIALDSSLSFSSTHDLLNMTATIDRSCVRTKDARLQ